MKSFKNQINNKYLFVPILSTALGITGCKNEKVDVSGLVAERDSIINVTIRQKQEINELNGYMTMIADGLDSIALKEGMIKTGGKEGIRLSKAELKQELIDLGALVSRQRKRISALEDTLRTKGGNVKNIQSIIDYLNQQLETKSKAIEQLQSELNRKNANIASLRSQISALNNNVGELEKKTQAQTKALMTQSDIMNEGYVKVGTKKELTATGLLSGGGLFSKKKLQINNINADKFTKIDIRQFQEVAINSRNPKLLTSHPTSSYRFVTNGNNTILKITDVNAFWSISNYLIIQTN